MMDAVQARRDDKKTEPALKRERQTRVRVMKENREQETRLPDGERERRDADEQDLRGAPDGGDADLAEVKAQSRRSVEVEVYVMRGVKTP